MINDVLLSISHILSNLHIHTNANKHSWIARRVQSFKRYILCKILSQAPKNCDKIKLVDRILDGMVFALLFVKILEYLSVETGMAIGSIFAVGSTGTLIISLGSQEIAKGVVNGVEMAASDRFYEGDNIYHISPFSYLTRARTSPLTSLFYLFFMKVIMYILVMVHKDISKRWVSKLSSLYIYIICHIYSDLHATHGLNTLNQFAAMLTRISSYQDSKI